MELPDLIKQLLSNHDARVAEFAKEYPKLVGGPIAKSLANESAFSVVEALRLALQAEGK